MKKRILMIFLLLLYGCSGMEIPPEFSYREIKTTNFTIASWQKITDVDAVYKIYIEGDGYAFDAHGRPTRDPTPKGTLVRELAFGDDSPNVIYLSRPCQYIKSEICARRHWTTARFAPEIINAEHEAVKRIVGNQPVVLVGFSGGAQVAGLISSAKTGLNVKKIITVAGNLDHQRWTEYHNVPPLNESMNLPDFKNIFATIPQIHYVGSRDEIIPPALVKAFIKNDDIVVVVPNAAHNDGWVSVYQKIRSEI